MDSEQILWLVVGAVVLAWIVHRLRLPNLDKAAEEAARQGDLNIILGAINRRGIYSRPAAYHHAIRYLWNNYQRPLASKLARHMASNHVESAIAQYWIREILAIEPKIARKVFDKKFLQTYYHPEVAAQCGPAG